MKKIVAATMVLPLMSLIWNISVAFRISFPNQEPSMIPAIVRTVSASFLRRPPQNNDTVVTATTEKFISPLGEDACLVEANHRLKPEDQAQKYIPVFSFVSIAPAHNDTNSIEKFYWITLTTKNLPKVKNLPQVRAIHYAQNVSWFCNDQPTGQALGDGCGHGHVVSVRCPYDQDGHLQNITGKPRTNPAPPEWANIQLVHYNISAHARCAEEEERLKPQQGNIGPATSNNGNKTASDLKITSCLIITGEKARDGLKQFVAYHRMQGYDRFFVYFHEAFNATTMSHQIPLNQTDITYIPAHMEDRGRMTKNGFFFQNAIENDCLHRSRAFGADFVGMHDVDEYIHVVADGMTLKEWLSQHLHEIHGGVQIEQNIWQLTKYHNRSSPIWLDNTVHNRHTHGGRHKNLVRPSQVLYHAVHDITRGSGPVYKANAFKELRFVHFRDGIRMTKPVEDLSLYQRYRDLVAKEIENMN
jgi:hypothetical protein